MRIAMFSDNFYPELSGISDSILVLGRELARRGHAIHFYVPRYSKRDYAKVGLVGKNPPLPGDVKFTRLASLHYPTGTGQGRLVFPTALRWLAMKKYKYDVIHTQLFFGTGLEGLFAAKFLGVPLVGTNHTAITEFLKYSPVHPAWLERATVSYVNWYYGKCRMTTAPSRSVTDEMEKFGFKGKSLVVSNPIDMETFRPLAGGEENLKAKFGFKHPTIIHAGRISPERKIDVLIRALPLIREKIPDAMLAFAGHGVQEGELRQLAAGLGVGEHIKFLGTLSKQDLNEAYNAADLFAITSTSDTQSLVMMQAMASGLPVVAVAARALPEYVNSENGALAIPGDSKDVAEKTIGILRAKDLRSRLSSGAVKSVAKFSPRAIAEVWEKIYAEAITPKS